MCTKRDRVLHHNRAALTRLPELDDRSCHGVFNTSSPLFFKKIRNIEKGKDDV